MFFGSKTRTDKICVLLAILNRYSHKKTLILLMEANRRGADIQKESIHGYLRTLRVKGLIQTRFTAPSPQDFKVEKGRRATTHKLTRLGESKRREMLRAA